MSTKTVRVESFQGSPESRNVAANTRAVLEAIAASDADIVVFPELYLGGYQTTKLHEISQEIDDATVKALGEACRKHGRALVVGAVEKDGDKYYDVLLAIDNDGTIKPFVRKTHLFGSERDYFSLGNKIEPVTLCGISVGLINCFEVEFPEIGRTLALKGAELLITSSANMSPYEDDHTFGTIARALENRLPHVYSNRVGKESGHDFCGLSRIVANDGKVIAQLDTSETGSIVSDIEINTDVLDEVAMLSQRRPELYKY